MIKNGKSIIVSKDITFEYVSIEETLKKLLENEEFLDTIKLNAANMVNEPYYYKSHPLFKNKNNMNRKYKNNMNSCAVHSCAQQKKIFILIRFIRLILFEIHMKLIRRRGFYFLF